MNECMQMYLDWTSAASSFFIVAVVVVVVDTAVAVSLFCLRYALVG